MSFRASPRIHGSIVTFAVTLPCSLRSGLLQASACKRVHTDGDKNANGALHHCAGGMKLTDFGLARMFGSPESGRYTHQVQRLHNCLLQS